MRRRNVFDLHSKPNPSPTRYRHRCKLNSRWFGHAYCPNDYSSRRPTPRHLSVSSVKSIQLLCMALGIKMSTNVKGQSGSGTAEGAYQPAQEQECRIRSTASDVVGLKCIDPPSCNSYFVQSLRVVSVSSVLRYRHRKRQNPLDPSRSSVCRKLHTYNAERKNKPPLGDPPVIILN